MTSPLVIAVDGNHSGLGALGHDNDYSIESLGQSLGASVEVFTPHAVHGGLVVAIDTRAAANGEIDLFDIDVALGHACLSVMADGHDGSFPVRRRGVRREGTEKGLDFPWNANKIRPDDVSDCCYTS